MQAPPSAPSSVDLARECLYRFLSVALSDPYRGPWDALVLHPASRQSMAAGAELLREQAAESPDPPAFGELPPEHLNPAPLLAELHKPVDVLRAEYDRVFGLVTPRQCPPYETEYSGSNDTFFRSQQLADIAGFYRAFGIEPAAQAPERPDHVSLELEFMAVLLLKSRLAGCEGSEAAQKTQVCLDAQRSFFADHLVWWVPAFTMGLRRKAGTGLYAALAQLLAAFVTDERRRFGIAAPQSGAQPTLIERPEEQSPCAACPLQI
jgi:TorA maturation chaperone TorD